MALNDSYRAKATLEHNKSCHRSGPGNIDVTTEDGAFSFCSPDDGADDVLGRIDQARIRASHGIDTGSAAHQVVSPRIEFDLPKRDFDNNPSIS